MPHKIIMIAVAAVVLSGGVIVGMMNDDGPGGTPATTTLTLADDGATVALGLGDRLVLDLEGNPTTGYTWETAGLDEAVLAQLGDPTYVPVSDAIGASGIQTFTFEAAGSGDVELNLVYHRPWESAAPLQTFTVTVTVG